MFVAFILRDEELMTMM
jgi:hypothetical protein